MTTMARSKVRRSILLAMLIGLACYVWFGPTFVRQRRWMAQAREQLPIVAARLRADPVFAQVNAAGVSTGGSVLLVGTVLTQSGLDRLHALVAEMKTQGRVDCLVRVAP